MAPANGGSPGGVRVAQPRLGQQESLIDERIAVPRRLSGKDAHLTILYLAQGPTVLPGDSHSVLAFFGKAALVHDHHPIGVPPIVIEPLVVAVAHRRLVPEIITHEPVHAPHVAPVDFQGERLDGFARQGAQLSDQIAEQMLAGFAPGEALAKGLMNAPQFMEETFDIAVF
jgi:hypothetical protein